jgi:VIT family
MTNETNHPAKRERWLDPYTLIAEVLFGLIMVLTFTGSLSVAEAGEGDVREMLIGALGCNIAWGVIDGIFYLMECVSEQGLGIRAWRALRKAGSPDEARQIIVDVLPPLVASTLDAAAYESIRNKILQMPEPPSRPRLGKREWLGALSVFFWVFIITFPVTIPFMFMEDLTRAMRFSNGIAIALLFMTGFAFARVAQYRPWLTGFAMVVIGSIVVAATIALGG